MRLIVEGLACIRGGRTVFRGLSCTVGAGEALLVTGPNGAGKTSFLRLVAGLLRPAAGSIRLEGHPLGAPIGIAAHFVGHLDGVKGALNAAENLDFAFRLAGGGGKDVAAALTQLGLAPLASFPARELSAGQRRRLALARLLVAPRPLWLVDEPTAALDADGQAIFQTLAEAHLSGGGALVATTHAPLHFTRSSSIRLGGDRP
jgi:heme exporter protein A